MHRAWCRCWASMSGNMCVPCSPGMHAALQAMVCHAVVIATHVPDDCAYQQAYYKQYNNLRPKYLENIWKVVNWSDVNARLQDAKSA